MKKFRVFGLILVSSILAVGNGCGGSSSSSSSSSSVPDPSVPAPSVSGIVSQIEFTSADPTAIAIKGVGLQATSTLTFTAVDSNGGVVSGATINFALNSAVGGITLSQASATSDSSGIVTTTVNAGDVPTSVVVTASLASDPTIFAYSNQLTISTGHADQDSFSLSASVLNPEAWSTDGIAVSLTVYASDHSSNPVPDGATVYFQAEGGQIDPYCILATGTCSVTWRSANRRPADDGRATITATMVGEESFSDVNGNGVLDDTDAFITHDIGEAFYDYNENGTFDAVANTDQNGALYYEEFLDFDGNLAYTPADGQYNGIKCNAANVVNVCSTQTSMDVRQNIVLVMSGSSANIVFDDNVLPTVITNMAIAGGLGGSGYARVRVYDLHTQPMPAGTTVAVKVPSDLTLNTPASYTVPNTNFNGYLAFGISVTVKATATVPSGGVITVTVTSPSGIVTSSDLPVTW